MSDKDRRNAAIRFYNEGVTQAQTGDKAIAFKMLNSSVEVDPSFPEGWFQVGNACGDMNLLNASVASFRRAIEANPLDAKFYVNIGHRLYHLGHHKEARKYTEKAIELDPSLAFAYCNLSLIESVEGNLKKALSLAKKAYSMNQDPIIEVGLAFAHLFAGELVDGLKHFESRFSYKLPEFNSYPYPKWKGEEGRVFIQAEQGAGDTLCFSRFMPHVAERAEHVIFAVQPELVRLMQAQLIGWDNIDVVALPCQFPDVDYWSTPTGLPTAIGLSEEQIIDSPWLPVPNFSAQAPWKSDRKFHIGICWAGSSFNDTEKWRRLPFELFLDLYKVPGIQLYGLQVGDRASDIENTGSQALVRNLFPYIRDYGDTISILNNLDLVITSETSLGWISALCQKEAWILYARNGGDYRIGRNPGKVLWAPQHRVFKQGEDASWQPVMDRVVQALKERMNNERQTVLPGPPRSSMPDTRAERQREGRRVQNAGTA